MIDVYVSPEHAGTSTATLAGWYVEWAPRASTSRTQMAIPSLSPVDR